MPVSSWDPAHHICNVQAIPEMREGTLGQHMAHAIAMLFLHVTRVCAGGGTEKQQGPLTTSGFVRGPPVCPSSSQAAVLQTSMPCFGPSKRLKQRRLGWEQCW